MNLHRQKMHLAGVVLLGLLATLLTPATLRAQAQVQPFIYLDVPPVLDLGSMLPVLPSHDGPTPLTLKLYSNITHAGVVMSLSPLQHSGGGPVITPDRVLVKRSDMTEYVPLSNPINVTGIRPPGYFEYTLQFRVLSNPEALDPAGTYSGTLTLTYGVAP